MIGKQITSWMKMGIYAIAFIALAGGCNNRKKDPATVKTAKAPTQASLINERAGHVTRLSKKKDAAEGRKNAPPAPPAELFQLVRYPSPVGNLAAYLSPDPGDGKKHPLVIWLSGGFSNSISELPWDDEQPLKNDQSASAYRLNGLAMMYPSLRGGNDNPGQKEGLYGEADDVIAAAEYAAKLPWVDANRIYLAGHSTGGTLALLVAELSEDRFRAVVSFGPVESTAGYGRDALPFDVKNVKETRLRAPVEFLRDITTPTFVIEGTESPGNIESLQELRQRNKNPRIKFIPVKDSNHFSLLAAANALIADKIVADTSSTCSLTLTSAEVEKAVRSTRDANYINGGNIQSRTGFFGAVFYYTPDPKTDPKQALQQALDKTMKGVPVVDSFAKAPAPPFIVMGEEKAPLENYPVPKESYFKHAGRGMKSEDIKGIQATKIATHIALVAPRKDLWKLARDFNVVCHDYATQTGAFIWDSATRECFHRDAWKTRRIDTWTEEGAPDLRNHITIHMYPRDDGSGKNRLITLGMEKFGLPDVLIERVLSFNSNAQSDLVNAVCQQLATDSQVSDPGEYGLDLSKLKPSSANKEMQSRVMSGGTGKATLALMRGEAEDGDPDNRLIELDFRHGTGKTDDERNTDVLAAVWGASEDKASAVRHDEEIQKASDDARVQFTKWKKKFQAGLPVNNRIIFKAPFPRDDEKGNEYMWLELLRWTDDDTLHGALINEPSYIKSLKLGAKATVKLENVFDYKVYFPNGSTEGNKTQELLEKQTGPAGR